MLSAISVERLQHLMALLQVHMTTKAGDLFFSMLSFHLISFIMKIIFRKYWVEEMIDTIQNAKPQ